MSLATEWNDMSVEDQEQAVAKVQEDLVSIIRYVIDTTKEFSEGKRTQGSPKVRYILDNFFKYKFDIILGMKKEGTSVRIEYEEQPILRVHFHGSLDGDSIQVQHRYNLEEHVEGTLNDMATDPDKYKGEYKEHLSLLQQRANQRAHEVKKQAKRLGVFLPSPILL